VVQACTNPTSTTVVSTDEIRGTKSYGDKFINENGWIIFRLDGTWEAQLDGSLERDTWRNHDRDIRIHKGNKVNFITSNGCNHLLCVSNFYLKKVYKNFVFQK
jgi:hypothetical protein